MIGIKRGANVAQWLHSATGKILTCATLLRCSRQPALVLARWASMVSCISSPRSGRQEAALDASYLCPGRNASWRRTQLRAKTIVLASVSLASYCEPSVDNWNKPDAEPKVSATIYSREHILLRNQRPSPPVVSRF